MWFKKNKNKDFLSLFLNTLCLIIGLDILITSFLIITKEEFKKTNLELQVYLNIKKLKYEDHVQFARDIY
tara:strand:+ start:441 stop:650 length:210 start_codon:yes stop_codon:yes gene_type:complete